MTDRRQTSETPGRTPAPRRTGRTLGAAVAVAVTALPLTGCFTYRTVETPGPVAGEEVRVELTGAGRDRLEASSGLAWDRIEGRLVDADSDDLAVSVRLDPRRLGFGSQEYVDTVRVARSDVREVEVRELSTGRSLLAAGGVVAVAASAYALFSAESSGGDGGEGNEQFVVVPVLKLLGGIGALLGR